MLADEPMLDDQPVFLYKMEKFQCLKHFGRRLRSLGRISTSSRHPKVSIFTLWGKRVLLHYFRMQLVLSTVVVI
jgi:hypothetical protein